MKRLFWIFTIRKRIKQAIARTEKEKLFFEEQKLKGFTTNTNDQYLSSRIELKKEIIGQLIRLL